MKTHDCNRIRRLVELDENWTPGSAGRLDAHLAECAECAAYAARGQALQALLAASPSRSVEEGFESRLRERVSREHISPLAWIERAWMAVQWRLQGPGMLATASLAAVLVVVSAGPRLLNPLGQRDAARSAFVRSAADRHVQLGEAAAINWDAVDASIEMNSADIYSDAPPTP